MGRGLSVQRGATVNVARGLFSRNREHGIFVGGERASLEVADAVVPDTEAQMAGGHAGRGLSAPRRPVGPYGSTGRSSPATELANLNDAAD